MNQYDEIRKISTGQGDDYTTGCLLDFAYFEKSYRLIAPYLIMLIQEQFKKLFLQVKQIIKVRFITFLKNQKKQF